MHLNAQARKACQWRFRDRVNPGCTSKGVVPSLDLPAAVGRPRPGRVQSKGFRPGVAGGGHAPTCHVGSVALEGILRTGLAGCKPPGSVEPPRFHRRSKKEGRLLGVVSRRGCPKQRTSVGSRPGHLLHPPDFGRPPFGISEIVDRSNLPEGIDRAPPQDLCACIGGVEFPRSNQGVRSVIWGGGFPYLGGPAPRQAVVSPRGEGFGLACIPPPFAQQASCQNRAFPPLQGRAKSARSTSSLHLGKPRIFA